jgi:hypothetical protein
MVGCTGGGRNQNLSYELAQLNWDWGWSSQYSMALSEAGMKASSQAGQLTHWIWQQKCGTKWWNLLFLLWLVCSVFLGDNHHLFTHAWIFMNSSQHQKNSKFPGTRKILWAHNCGWGQAEQQCTLGVYIRMDKKQQQYQSAMLFTFSMLFRFQKHKVYISGMMGSVPPRAILFSKKYKLFSKFIKGNIFPAHLAIFFIFKPFFS